MAFLSEDELEQTLLAQLDALGYSIEREENIGPDGHRPERESHDEVVFRKRFKKLVSSHHKLADALNDLRNKAGPASHEKDPYLERLAEHHRRSAVLAADAIVAFLHQAYLDAQLDPISSREPWERFAEDNLLIDAHVGLAVDAENGDSPTLRFLLPSGDELPINIEINRLLYQLDRDAYVEALNAARGVPTPVVETVDQQGVSA